MATWMSHNMSTKCHRSLSYPPFPASYPTLYKKKNIDSPSIKLLGAMHSISSIKYRPMQTVILRAL